MKYLIVLVVLFCLWMSSNQAIDLSAYQRETKRIEVKGEVSNPGVYEVDYHSSVEDVINEAGGVLEEADLRSINLGQDLSHQSVIVIPKSIDYCISINTASMEELTSLSSVGPATAQRIIDYREEHSFQTIEDIMNVKGIKEKSFEKIKESICL